jgi:hypothetical protein
LAFAPPPPDQLKIAARHSAEPDKPTTIAMNANRLVN